MVQAGGGRMPGRGGKGGRGGVLAMLPSPPLVPRTAFHEEKQDQLKRMLENYEVKEGSEVPQHLRSGEDVHGMMSKLARIVYEQGSSKSYFQCC